MWPFKKKVEEPAPVKTRTITRTKRNYAAANVADRLNASWTANTVTPDQLIFHNLKVLRARSREQMYNNDYAKRFVSMVKSNVVGQQGIQVQSKVEGPRGDQDKPAQMAIEKAFKDWGKKANCDLKGELSFVSMQSLAMATIAVDGEVFIRRHTAGKYAYQLELVDPELVDISYNEELKNGNTIRFGIEYDALGRVAAYHFVTSQNRSTPEVYYSEQTQKHYVRVKASEVTHLFLKDFLNQRRGLPWMSTALQRMKMLNGYEDAALVAARAGASKMGFYTSENGNEYTGDEVDSDGSIIEEFEAGTMTQLPEGVGFQSFDPDYPKGEFGPFIKTCLRGIASGLSISYNTLANDLEGVNFSSMRHGAVEEREVWKCLQAWLTEYLIQPVYEDWLSRAWELELITIKARNGAVKPLNRPLEIYLPAAFQPRRWDWVDPLKDIQAKKEEIALGVTSVSAVIRDKGHDPETVWSDIEKERPILQSLGINIEEMTNEQPSKADQQQTPPAQSDAEQGSD